MSESKSYLVTIMKWRISEQGCKHLTKIRSAVSTMQRITLSASSVFVTERLFIHIYFLLFEENCQNRVSRARDKISLHISVI